MEDQAPRVRTETQGAVTIVELLDKKLLDEAGIAKLTSQLTSLIRTDAKPRLVLDFLNVAHMSSSALGMLITLHKRLREKGGLMRLCNIRPAIQEVFVITRLDEVFRICPTRQDAVREAEAA
jgi:anti-sigma B factor antagonist